MKNVAELDAQLGLPVTASANVTVSNLPQLRVVKTADVAVVEPVGEITYSIDFENTGALPADGVVVADILPTGTRFSLCSDNCVHGKGAQVWQVGRLPPGQAASVTVSVVADPGAANGTVISNNASIKSDSSPTALSPLVETVVLIDGENPRPARVDTLASVFMLLLMVCTGFIGARAAKHSNSGVR
ncbi:hypothetical protein A3709_10105 [Halioglobus sp. HI00S01]|nr:hypothetical protein A3709_10105 [Halioglobus sp. HI00S01]